MDKVAITIDGNFLSIALTAEAQMRGDLAETEYYLFEKMSFNEDGLEIICTKETMSTN